MATLVRMNSRQTRLLDSHRLRQIAGEVNVETLHDREPVSNQLQGDDVQEPLEDVDSLGDLNRLGLAAAELAVAGVADYNGLATARDNYQSFKSQSKSGAYDGTRKGPGLFYIPCW